MRRSKERQCATNNRDANSEHDDFFDRRGG